MTKIAVLERVTGLRNYLATQFSVDRQRALDSGVPWSIAHKVYERIWARDIVNYPDVDPQYLSLVRKDVTENWCAHNVELQHIDSVIALRYHALIKRQ